MVSKDEEQDKEHEQAVPHEEQARGAGTRSRREEQARGADARSRREEPLCTMKPEAEE